MKNPRKAIAQAIKDNPAWSYKKLSALINKNDAYVQQYVTKGTPRDLKIDHAVKIAMALGIELSDLIEDEGLLPIAEQMQSHLSFGFQEETRPFDINEHPQLDALYNDKSNVYGWTVMNSDALKDIGVKINDILMLKEAPQDYLSIPNGSTVVCQLYSKEKPQAVTIVRQFIHPNKLMTNRPTQNETIDMDDSTLPFTIVIKAIVTSSFTDRSH